MLTAVVFAHDETSELTICLESLGFADSIIVIADNPTPETLKIIRQFPVRLIFHPLNHDFAAQHNFALTRVKTDWVLFLDADEMVTSQLASDILRAITNPGVTGCYLHRVDRLWGWTLKYGDLSHVYLLRLGRRQAGKWTGRVHETWQIDGHKIRLSGDLLHTPHPSVISFLTSINYYSSIRAEELAGQGHPPSLWQIIFWPPGKFIYLWIFKLGFLDGIPGLVHALVMSFYSFLVRGKLYLLVAGYRRQG